MAVTLTSGRTAFSSPVTLRLPYPDAEPDGVVDGTSPALAALALTVWRFDTARSTWVRLPEARVFPAFHEVRVATTQTGLYGVFQAADGSTGLAGTTAPASPAPLSAGAQGSGWQDIGVVTTFPFLVPVEYHDAAERDLCGARRLCHAAGRPRDGAGGPDPHRCGRQRQRRRGWRV